MLIVVQSMKTEMIGKAKDKTGQIKSEPADR